MLIEGSKIVAVGASIDAADAAVIDAQGCIVIPGFIDTHHHQFETALRGALADAILINDGRPESANNYYESVLLKSEPGLPPAGRLHQRTVRLDLADRRRRHGGP